MQVLRQKRPCNFPEKCDMRCLGVDRKEREDEGDGDKSNNGEEIN